MSPTTCLQCGKPTPPGSIHTCAPLCTVCVCGHVPESVTEQQAGICYDCAPERWASLQDAALSYLAARDACCDTSGTVAEKLGRVDAQQARRHVALAALRRAAGAE